MSIITMINIGADGLPMPEGSTDKHVAVLFPQIGWMVTATPFNPEELPQEELEEEAKKVSLLGADDWKLADIELLRLCSDPTRRWPAFDPAHFYGIPAADWLWSSTEVAGDPAFAWYVYALLGYVGNGPRLNRGFGLAARFVGQ